MGYYVKCSRVKIEKKTESQIDLVVNLQEGPSILKEKNKLGIWDRKHINQPRSQMKQQLQIKYQKSTEFRELCSQHYQYR